MIDIHLIPIFARSHSIHIQFSNLQLAFDRIFILHIVGSSIEIGMLGKELFHLIDGEISLILLIFSREASS